MGGAAGYNTKWRDLGCPLVAVSSSLIIGLRHWSLVIAFGLLFGAMTTYWKRKGEDALWYNWLMTGFMYAMAFLPIVWFLSRFEAFFYFTAFLSIATMIWSEVMDDVVWEECGRGAILIIAQAAFLIFR
jgi:hypothetical protein